MKATTVGKRDKHLWEDIGKIVANEVRQAARGGVVEVEGGDPLDLRRSPLISNSSEANED
jgi:hypothetical protein